jgi:hypothetical protein
MWWKTTVVWVGCAVALGCGSKAKNGAMGAVGTGGTSPGTGTGGSTGTGGAAVGTGTGSGGTGTGGAGMLCPAGTVTSCGGQACPAIAANLAMICVQSCCTADMKCGQHNAITNSACMDSSAIPAGMCPSEMIFGQMVAACCVPNTNTCGILDATGLAGGGCIARSMVPAQLGALAPKNCDGTTPPAGMAGAGAGTGGMGTGGKGTGGMGTGGMGTGGTGTGGMGTGGTGTGGTGTGGTGTGGSH